MIKNRIREFRAKYNLKQDEKGWYNPSLVLAWKIAQVFHVSIEDVFTVGE